MAVCLPIKYDPNGTNIMERSTTKLYLETHAHFSMHMNRMIEKTYVHSSNKVPSQSDQQLIVCKLFLGLWSELKGHERGTVGTESPTSFLFHPFMST